MIEYKYPKNMRMICDNKQQEAVFREMVITGLDFLDKHADTAVVFKDDTFEYPKRDELEYEIAKIGMFSTILSIPLLAMRRGALKHIMYIKCYGWDKYCKDIGVSK